MRMTSGVFHSTLVGFCLIAFLSACVDESASDSASRDSGGDTVTVTVAQPGIPSDARSPLADFDGSPLLQPLGGDCLDTDGDGYGTNCALGPDCNDTDRSVTDQCYRCARPATDCPCDTPGARRPCDVVTDSDLPGPDGTCRLGERVCTNGRWSRCMALDGRTRTITPPAPCGSTCNPECRVTTVCPTSPSDLSGGSGVVIGSSPLPGYCPMGTGGITLPGGTSTAPPPTCTVTCGGRCCAVGQECWTQTDTSVYPSWCYSGGRVAPPPVTISACGRACPVSQRCGFPPNEQCCTAGQICRYGVCVTPTGTCRTNADCPAGSFCDRNLGRCIPSVGGRCNCEGDAAMQQCLTSVVTTGGDVINGIFRTANGQDARTLRFARYMRGIETNPTGCPIGRSSYSTDPQFRCTSCTPTICDAWACFSGPRDTTTIGRFADRLDWLWTQHVRFNDWGGAVSDGDSRFYYPWRARIYDLGAPANRVVLFPITDHTSDSCLEPFEYTVWLSDNPNSTEIADPRNPDPNKWNQATLVRVFTQGWTRNPRAIGDPSDTNDLETTAFGDAVADAMTTVWALPCGYSFRYAAVSAGNNGSPTSACAFHSHDDELDAVAGLTVEGNSLSIYHVLPYGSTAGPDGLSFSTQVRTADVYFLFDTTGSMGGELANLRSSLTTGTYVSGCTGGIIGGIRCIIPDAWFGVGYFDDFPRSPYGGGPDRVYQNVLDLTSNAAAAQTAVNSLTIHWGYDGPESHVPALWAVATGRGFPGYLSDRTGCPAGRFGYPCFRPGTIPIVMMFTDAMFHNGPGNTYMYDDRILGITSPRFADAVNELNRVGAKVIVINSCDGQWWCTPDAQNHAVALANNTRSIVSGGAPAVYNIRSDGSGLSTAVINAVSDLANYSRMDVTAVALDNPATPTVDERCFVRSPVGAPAGTVRLSNPAIGESAPYPSGRCVDPPGSVSGVPVVARQCLPGTTVNFRAEFANNCVPSTSTQQVFNFDIVVLGNGTYELGRVPVTIVVPASAYPPSGTFTYDVDATTACRPGQFPDWTQLQFAADTPTGTSIRIDVQTAATSAGLATAPVVNLGTVPPASSPLDIGAALVAAGQSNRLPYLRVTFTLNSNATRDRAPTLMGYRVLFNCIDGS